MRVHLSKTTRKFLPDKMYKTENRGILEIEGKPSLKTYLVVGKYDQSGILQKYPYAEEVEKATLKTNDPKWQGFKLIN